MLNNTATLDLHEDTGNQFLWFKKKERVKRLCVTFKFSSFGIVDALYRAGFLDIFSKTEMIFIDLKCWLLVILFMHRKTQTMNSLCLQS